MKHCLSIILLAFSISLHGQQKYNPKIISGSTEVIVSRIAEINQVLNAAVGSWGKRNQQYNNFEELTQTASREELIELTNHPNAAVRCYALWALIDVEEINLFPIVLNHIYDYKPIYTQFGDLGADMMAGDFIIDFASPPAHSLSQRSILDSVQCTQLDSILIYSKSKLAAKELAIARAKPTASLYPRIKELVIKSKNQDALITLAKYRRPKDIPLILKNKSKEFGYSQTYMAIQEFPHEDFLPFLEKNLYKILSKTGINNEWRALYEAIAAYKSQKAVELLSIPFTQIKHHDRDYHIAYVFNAVREQKCETYVPLLWKLWEEENRISLDVYQYLTERDSAKAYELTQRDMIESNYCYSTPFYSNKDHETGQILLATMLDLIMKKDYELGLEVIRKNIKVASIHHIAIFTDKAIELKDKSFIEPLFDVFREEANVSIYLKIASALLSYHDDAVNERILETRLINDELNNGWGSEWLDKLLNEHHLLHKTEHPE